MYDVKTIIDVECLQDADSPCLTKSFSCEGKLEYLKQSNSFEIISVFCNPEEVESLKSEDETVLATESITDKVSGLYLMVNI